MGSASKTASEWRLSKLATARYRPSADLSGAPLRSLKSIEADVQLLTASIPPLETVHLNGAANKVIELYHHRATISTTIMAAALVKSTLV